MNMTRNLRSSFEPCTYVGKLALSGFLILLLMSVSILSCKSDSTNQNTPTPRVTKAQLAGGTYKVSFGFDYAIADEQKILAITANLDRTSQQLVFTMKDGTKKTTSFTPRDESQWQGDCAAMGGSYVLDEVADLAPAPLQLESMTFDTPLVYAKCSPLRMILSINTSESGTTPMLVFDLVN
jgi:hypothetical protein